MTVSERKLVKSQLKQAELFKENTVTYWVRDVATQIISKLEIILSDGVTGNNLKAEENDVQVLCDIFEGSKKAIYGNKENYQLALEKYDGDLEPFNHIRQVHNLLDRLI